MPSSIAEAGYKLSQAAINEQNERLGELRGRAATLLAAASIAASFLGGQSIRAGDLGVVSVLAVIAYLVCVVRASRSCFRTAWCSRSEARR